MDLVSAVVGFGDEPTLILTETETYPISSLLSDVGGAAGKINNAAKVFLGQIHLNENVTRI